MGIGAKIKEYRTNAGLTQKDLADKLFVTYQAVSRWENEEAEPSIDTIKEICGILGCSTDDLFGIDKKPENEEPKEEEPVKVVEKVIVQEPKVVLGICEKCSKPIYEANDLKKHEEKYRVQSGRSSFLKEKTVVLCASCDEKRIKEEKAAEARRRQAKLNEDKKRRIHSFVWPGIAAAICIAFAIASFTKGNSSNGVFWIATAVLGFVWLGTMILDNTFITELWIEVASWGFVKMPGVIFSFSFDGLIFLIVVKVFLFLLGIGLAILSVLFATVLAMALSIFVYPFALSKNIRGVE